MPTEGLDDWVDVSWIEDYLTNQVSLPNHWIFVQDDSCIFPDFHSLKLFDRIYKVIFFVGHPQVRQELEKYKDNRESFCACIVSRQPPEVNLHILDYTIRSQCIKVTPQSILEFAQPGYSWTREGNQLKGADFWSLFEQLQEYRLNYPRFMTPVEGTNLVLSARLETDLRSNLSVREAIDTWQRMEKDEDLIAWGEQYPKLFQALNLKVRAALPLMEKLDGDTDFVPFLWASYSLAQHNEHYDLFLPRIFGETIWKKYGNTPPEEIRKGCHELIRNDPERVIDQIKQTEIWLTQDRQRLELFQTWVGMDGSNIRKTVEYAKKETLFCVPMREALRILAAHLCHSPEALEAADIHEIVANIQRKHLFLQDATNYLRIKDTFRAFADLVALNQLIGSIQNKSWLDTGQSDFRPFAHPSIRLFAYTAYLSKLDLMADGLEQLNFQCDLLPSAAIAQILDRADKLTYQHNGEFSQWIASVYPTWTSADRNEPLLTIDFLDLLFLPRYQQYIQETPQSVYIFIFDGLRWDTWEVIKPKVLSTFQGKFALEGVFPLVSILPTTTAYNKYAIFTGEFPTGDANSNWWEALPDAFQKRGVDEVQWVNDRGDNQSQIIDLIEADEVPLKIFNLTFIDQKLHHAAQNLSTIYEEIKVNFDLLVQPYLERIPNNSLIFLLSDHGFIEATKHWRISEDVFQTSPIPEIHRRYIGLSSSAARVDLAHLTFFSANQIGLQPAGDTLHYGFATARTQILPSTNLQSPNSISPRGPSRYAHGGISMQEMIVPCAVFVPTAKGQLEIFPPTTAN